MKRQILAVHQDAVAGLVLLLFCALAFWLTTRLETVPAMLSQNVPPTFFPRLVLAMIALLSVALVARGFRRSREARERVEAAVYVTAAIVTGSIFLVAPLGMLLTVSLLAVALPLCWGERRAGRIAILAVVLPLAIYVVFTLALGVRFPAGVLAALVS